MLHFQEWVLLNKLTNKYDKALKLFLKLKSNGKDINLAMHAAASTIGVEDKEFHDYLWDLGYHI
jgi:hypothetical protein